MRRYQWTMLVCGTLAIGLFVRPAAAQPGHDPFAFGEFEIEDYERTLVPEGVADATIVFDGLVPGFHPAAIAAGEPSVPYPTGAPIFLEDSSSAWEQYGGILGHVPDGGVTPSNFHNIFPGGTTVANETNGGQSRNQPNTPASYNGTKISLVTRTDENMADDVGITSGDQALRVSMLNVGQGDGNTSFDRPASLVIKPLDFWGVADSRFDTFEMVRANPGQFSVSLDITYLADEIPDTCACDEVAPNAYFRLGFYSNHAGAFDESPPSVLQGPDLLVFGDADDDNDDIPDFSDPDYVDPDNPTDLPGSEVPGVIQRRYTFPASAMTWPAESLAGVADGGNRQQNGGYANAYILGFVFNGNWEFGEYASFIVDNLRFVDRFPLESVDFNHDEMLDVLDWEILFGNLNSISEELTFEDGDIAQAPNGLEAAVSLGEVDFDDFVRFEEIWDFLNGGAGSFRSFLADQGVPEPSSIALLMLGVGSLALMKRRRVRTTLPILLALAVAAAAETASAQLTNTLFFDWEEPFLNVPDDNPDFPFWQEHQRWQSADDAANLDMPPVLGLSATGATEGSTQALSIQQNGDGFSWDAEVDIFGGEEGLPDQQQALNQALDIGANHYQLELDVTYQDASIPNASFVNMAVRLQAGGASTDEVSGLAEAGDGSGPIPDQTVHLAIPLSIDPIDTGDGVLSVPNQADLAGFYNITLGFDGDWGVGSATFFVDNVRLVQVSEPPRLLLEVDETTGEAVIRKDPASGAGAVTFDYYEITSSALGDYNENGVNDAADYTVWRDTLGEELDEPGTGADGDGDGVIGQGDYDMWKANFGMLPPINVENWDSLDEQNIDAVDGPDDGAVAGDSSLEGWDASGSPSSSILSEAFLLGSTTVGDSDTISLGTIFEPGGPHTIGFVYREPTRNNFLLGTDVGVEVVYINGGAGSLASAAVPEPSSLLLMIAAVTGLAGLRSK